MYSVKAVLFASAAGVVLASATPANAQTFNWTGFYAGLNAGGVWGRSDATTSIPCARIAGIDSYICDTESNVASRAVAANGTGSLSKSGFTGGIQAGYNWQASNLVYGMELDFGAFNLRASRSATANYAAGGLAVSATNIYTIGSTVHTDWLFTARGRLGWAFSNMLLYGTGGLAVTNLKVASTFSDNVMAPAGASASGSASSTKLGWTWGAGAEWALSKNWSVKGEYLYLNFGSVTAFSVIGNNFGAVAYAQGLSTSWDLTAHVARAGVNYKF